MIIVHKSVQADNSVKAKASVVHEGLFEIGELHFPNKITWTRFIGALQRGSVGMRDFEVRLDATNPTEMKAENEIK